MIAGRDEPAPRGAPAALASAKARARRAGVGPREHRKRRAVAGARGGPRAQNKKRDGVSTLHITNGDCAAGTLRQFLTDPVSITADVLHEGPAPHVDLNTWHQLRARSLAQSDQASFEDTRNDLARSDRAIAEADRYDEVVLWFEHDLFDQLLLIRTLDL